MVYASEKRIFLNTFVTYSRTIIAVCLVLYSSRWVLKELGTSDFGLFSLIGSVLMFVSFFNTVLANGDSRFFSIMIGKNDLKDMQRLFKSSFILHMCLTPILVIIGWFVGDLAIKYFLDISEERISAALIILHISLIAVFFGMISVPFKALFIAHQNIVITTVIELLQTILFFFAAYSLRYYEGDKLIFYSFLYASTQILIYILFIVYALRRYKHCIDLLNSTSDRIIIKSILKYSFWNALGDIGHLVRTQGTAIVVNLLFGTQGNAALGIANQVSMQASGLSNSLLNATSPEIYRRVGANNICSAISLSTLLNKVAVLLIFLLAVPLIVHMDEILDLWLVNVPANAADLCICFIVMYIIERYTTGYLIMLKAINRISKVQLLIFICYLLSVVFPFCGFCDYWGIKGIGLSCILSMFLSRIMILFVYRSHFKLHLSEYLLHFCVCSIVILLITIVLFKMMIANILVTFVDIIWSSVLFCFVVSVLYYIAVFNKSEKKSLGNIIKQKFK